MPDSTFGLIYLRKSRDTAELADPDLLHKHRRELLRLATDAGYHVPAERIFEEQGSGQTIRLRPACRHLLEFLDRLPRGHGGGLWTTEVARLTRGSLPDRARLYEALVRPGIIHCTRAGRFDLSDTHQLHFWEDQAESASYELGVYKDRVQAARVEMILEGRIPTGHPPFGWVWDRNVANPDGSRGAPVADLPRFAIVEALCAEAPHLSTYRLAEKYGLTQNTVINLLRNPFVCGWPAKRFFPHEGAKTRTDNGEPWLNPSIKAPVDQWIWAEQPGNWPAACTRDEWETIQRALDERRDARAKTGSACGWCRSVVRFVGYEPRARLGSRVCSGGTQLVYELSASRRDYPSLWVLREEVHAAALAAIAGLLADPVGIQRGVDLYMAARRPENIPDASALEAEVARLERLTDSLLDRELRAMDAGDTREVGSIMRLRADYKRQMDGTEAVLKALRSQINADPAVDDLLLLLQEFDSADLAAAWEEAFDDTARQRMVSGIIAEIPCRVERSSGYWWRREVESPVLRPYFRG